LPFRSSHMRAYVLCASRSGCHCGLVWPVSSGKLGEEIAAWQGSYQHISLYDAGLRFGFTPTDTQVLHPGTRALFVERLEEGNCQTALLPSEAWAHSLEEIRGAVGRRTDPRVHLRVIKDPSHPCHRLRLEHPLSMGTKPGREHALGLFTKPSLPAPIPKGTLIAEYAHICLCLAKVRASVSHPSSNIHTHAPHTLPVFCAVVIRLLPYARCARTQS